MFMAQVDPGEVTRRALWYQDGHDVFVAEFSEAVAVSQYLAEAQPELLFFILVRDALDLGDEDGFFGFPGKVEVRLVREPGTRFNPCPAEDLRQLVLGVGMALEAALDKGRINREWLPLARQGAYRSFPVFRTKHRGRDRRQRAPGDACPAAAGERGEELDELRRQLIQVGLLGAGLVPR